MRHIMLGFTLVCALFSYRQTPVVTQTLPLSEVSGVVNIGNNRVALVADEGFQVQLVSEAAATFKAGDAQSFSRQMKPIGAFADGRKKVLDDLEDLAWDDARQSLFLITSHSRSSGQTLEAVADAKADKPQRHKLSRLVFCEGRTEPLYQETDTLEDALKKFPFVVEAMKKRPLDGGFNIEGLAFVKETGALLIGLRAPTQPRDGQACAVVLTLKNPHALFDKPGAAPDFEPQPQLLTLGGAGIRAMTYDAQLKGVWLVAGRSADPDAPADKMPSTLWFWDLSSPPRKAPADLLELENLEGVCLLDRDAKRGLLLVSDDGDDNPGSRYLWIPIPQFPDNKQLKPRRLSFKRSVRR